MANSFENEQEAPEMETLANLAENLVYRLPGCTDLMIRKTLRETYRDFCRRSCCLRVRRHFILQPNQSFVNCACMYGGYADLVSYVKWNDICLIEGRDYIVNLDGSYGAEIKFANRLVPASECPVENLPRVEVVLVEVPDIGSENAPSWFIKKHGDDICSGVLYRLMSMTGKAWSDASQAGTESVNYNNAVNEERTRYYAGSGTGAMRAIPNDELL